MADDWEDMTVDARLDYLRSAVSTLAVRLEELLAHVSDLSDTVEAIESKLRQ